MTAPAFTLGLSGVLYRNTGSYASPTWVAIGDVDDLDMTFETDEADATTRGGGGDELVMPAISKKTVEFGMKYDKNDAQWQALQTAYFARSTIEFLVADATVAQSPTPVAAGLRATFCITKFGRSEKLKEVMSTAVTLRPTPSANNPAWVTGM